MPALTADRFAGVLGPRRGQPEPGPFRSADVPQETRDRAERLALGGRLDELYRLRDQQAAHLRGAVLTDLLADVRDRYEQPAALCLASAWLRHPDGDHVVGQKGQKLHLWPDGSRLPRHPETAAHGGLPVSYGKTLCGREPVFSRSKPRARDSWQRITAQAFAHEDNRCSRCAAHPLADELTRPSGSPVPLDRERITMLHAAVRDIAAATLDADLRCDRRTDPAELLDVAQRAYLETVLLLACERMAERGQLALRDVGYEDAFCTTLCRAGSDTGVAYVDVPVDGELVSASQWRELLARRGVDAGHLPVLDYNQRRFFAHDALRLAADVLYRRCNALQPGHAAR